MTTSRAAALYRGCLRGALLWLAAAAPLVRADPTFQAYKIEHIDLPPPPDLDVGNEHLTSRFRVRFAPAGTSKLPCLNCYADWRLRIRALDGSTPARVAVSVNGDMPLHRHGLPTVPTVEAVGTGGDFVVHGVKLHMPGWWRFDVTVVADGTSETVSFNLVL